MSIVVIPPSAGSGVQRDGQTGLLAPTHPAVGLSAGALVANQIYLARFVPERDMNATIIGFAVSTAGTDDPYQVGIYNSDLTTLLGSRAAGVGAAGQKLNATGGKAATLDAPVPLSAGTVYYAAFAANSTAALVHANLASFAGAAIFGSAAPQLIAATKTASYPLPASVTSPAQAGSTVLLAVREA